MPTGIRTSWWPTVARVSAAELAETVFALDLAGILAQVHFVFTATTDHLVGLTKVSAKNSMGKHAYESHQIELVTASLVVILYTGKQTMVNKGIAPKEKILY